MLRRSILSLMLVNFSFGLFAKDKLPTKGLANINVSQIAANLKALPANANTADAVRVALEQKADKNAAAASEKSLDLSRSNNIRHQGKIKIP